MYISGWIGQADRYRQAGIEISLSILSLILSAGAKQGPTKKRYIGMSSEAHLNGTWSKRSLTNTVSNDSGVANEGSLKMVL